MAEGREPTTRSSTDVSIDRVYDGAIYARVNTIGVTGDRPFVLVPGIGVSSTYFERLAPNLNEFGPVHALDLPGFGGVPHPGRAMTIRQYADLVGNVLDDLDLNDPIIVGHSMGTQIVTDLVARRPDISTLVLIGPVVDADHRNVFTQAWHFLQASWHEPFTVKVLALSAYVLCGVKWFSRILPKMMRYPIEDHLPDVQANTLVIRGEFDAVCPRRWIDRVSALLPTSHAWEMPGAAHSVMHAHAEEVAKLCVDHAREGAGGADQNELQHYENAHDGIPDDAGPASAKDLGKAIRGRLKDTVGVITGDDDLVEEGKTEHAEAMETIHSKDGTDDG